MKSFLSLKKNYDSLIAAAIGFIAILLFTHYGGIGISPDSIMYTSVARNINAGKWLLGFDEKPLVLFPVLYPVFLGVVMFLTRMDVIVFAPYLNGILFAAVIYLSGCIIQQFKITSRLYKALLLMIIIACPCLTDVYSMLWSETLFIFWILLFIVFFHQYLQNNSTKNLWIISCIAALSCITRYAGVTLVGTGGLLIICFASTTWIKKIYHSIVFGMIGISLLTINLLRNQLSTGLLTGVRQKGIVSLHDNIQFFGNVLSDWLPFASFTRPYSFILGLLFLSGALITFVYRVSKQKNYNSFENIASVFFLVFGWFMVISATVSRYEPINSRLLSPLFIPFIWFTTQSIPSIVKTINNKLIKVPVVIVSAIVAFILLYQHFQIDTATYKNESEGGIGGYTEDDWKVSATLQYLKKDSSFFNPIIPVFSNANHAVYFYTGRSVYSLPERVHTNKVVSLYATPTFKLIWFNSEENFDLLTLEELKQKKYLIPIKTFSDGTLFLCTSDSTLIQKK
jgi:hypothetical protein